FTRVTEDALQRGAVRAFAKQRSVRSQRSRGWLDCDRRTGRAAGKQFLDGWIAEELSAFQVNEQHLAGTEASAFDDVTRRQVGEAGFRSGEHQAAARDRVAARTQAVAIEGRADEAAVGKAERRRAVPGLE